MKDLECPNCGGADPRTISPGKFKCKFCDTEYVDKEMMMRHEASEKEAARRRSEDIRSHAQVQQAKAVSGMSRRVLLVVVISLLLVFGFVGYMAMKSMEDTQKKQEELMKEFRQE